MKQSNESHEVVRQNDQTVQKSQKHDANLRKNSTLYFQMGLIMCLLASYTALEMSFAKTINKDVVGLIEEPEDVYSVDTFVIEKESNPEPETEAEPQKPKVKDPIDFEVVDDDTKLKKEFEKEFVKPVKKPKNTVFKESDLDIEPPNEPMNIMAVQRVPIYPGCEKAKNNEERRKCMSKKLSKLISKKFDSDLGGELGLSGKQKIYVNFKIDKNGNVNILKIKAPHPRLKKEANRVVSKVPRMEPGKNNNEAVEVLYNLPITLNVQN